jgi:non-specific serine/threonine protein kinase
LRRRDAQGALAFLKEAFTLFESKQEQQGLAVVLEHLATLCAATAQPDRAALFLGAADAIRRRIGAARWATEQARADAALKRVHAALDAGTARQAWEAGGALSTADVGVEVLASSVPDGPADPEHANPERDLLTLTRREREVAVLVAGGKTNREIATALFISERTADNHVQHILNKLGFTSRSQIAAWAATHGLLSQE